MAEAANTTPMTRWASQIAGTAVLIEAWSWSKPAAHMVKRLAERLGAIAPTVVLDADAVKHFGAWTPNNQEGNDDV
jgi:hypothetical protein